MNKIQRISLFCRIVFQGIFISLPILLFFSWIYAPQPLVLLVGSIQLNPIPHPYQNAILHTLTLSERFYGFLLSSIPIMIEMFILYFLIKLFKAYENSEIFSVKNVVYIKNIAYALLIGQIISPIYEGLMGIILTLGNPHGHRFATITFDQTNFGILLIALLTILISWIMAEGYNLREEQQLTI